MPRVTFVKKAKRPVPSAGIEVGDSYYWWAFRTAYSSRKCFSKTPPKPSQLTQSEFRSTLLSIEESVPSFSSVSDVESWVEDAKSQLEDLKSETEKRLYEEADVVDLLEGIRVERDTDDFRSGPVLVGSITVEHV